jgi:hypothetical protein
MYRTYQLFINSQIEQGLLLPGPTYFTGQYIDLFFAVMIANSPNFSPRYAKKFMYALDWFAKRDEYTRGEVHVNGRATVMEALETQKWAHRAAGNGRNGKPLLDPHDARRTMILSDIQFQMAVHAAVMHNDWMKMLVAWTVCEQTMLRTSSLLVLKFCDLLYNTSHGPGCRNSTNGERVPMLEILLVPGLHKTGKDKTLKDSTGMYRHKTTKFVVILHLQS